jgi:hypothetical protein
MLTVMTRHSLLRWFVAALLVVHYSAASATSFGGTAPVSRSAAGAGAGDSGLIPTALRWGERAGLQAVTGKFTTREIVEFVFDDALAATAAVHHHNPSSFVTRVPASAFYAAALHAFDARAPPAIG